MTWIVILGILAAALAGGGGAAYASNDALPGDALYPVRTMLQDLELAFSDDAGDLDLLLGNMDENLGDLVHLANQQRFNDMLIGLEEYEENLQAMHQTRTRLSYEDAGTEDSLNIRIQSQLQLHTQLLEQLKLQTQDQLKIQEKLQQAIQLTETGNTYGPNDGGKPDEPGAPNGAGPGEPVQEGKPDDAGSGQEDSGKPEDAGSGQGDAGYGPGGKPEDAGTGSEYGYGPGEQQVCTCMEEALYCVMGEVQNEFGEVLEDTVCTCMEEPDTYCVVPLDNGQYGQNGDSGQGGKP